MLKKVLPFLPLIILYGYTINLIVVVLTTSVTLQKPHFFGFGILIISSLLFLVNKVAGHLGTLLLLFLGAFFKASCTPAVVVYGIGINGTIDFSPHHLILAVLFLIINTHSIPAWIRVVFDGKKV